MMTVGYILVATLYTFRVKSHHWRRQYLFLWLCMLFATVTILV